VLREHCAAEGRPYEQIEKTTYGQLNGDESAEQLVERFQRLAELGIDHAIVEPPQEWREGSLERLAEAVPSVSARSPPTDQARRRSTAMEREAIDSSSPAM
jgi:hypothetical protein